MQLGLSPSLYYLGNLDCHPPFHLGKCHYFLDILRPYQPHFGNLEKYHLELGHNDQLIQYVLVLG